MNGKTRELKGRPIANSRKSILFELGDGGQHWIPFSLIERSGEKLIRLEPVTIHVEEWFAERKGIK